MLTLQARSRVRRFVVEPVAPWPLRPVVCVVQELQPIGRWWHFSNVTPLIAHGGARSARHSGGAGKRRRARQFARACGRRMKRGR